MILSLLIYYSKDCISFYVIIYLDIVSLLHNPFYDGLWYISNSCLGRYGKLKNSKNLGILVAVVLALASSLVVSGLLTVSKTLSSTGSVKAINVEVFWDLACTQAVDSIDWGTPEPGDSVSRTVYVRNTGSAPMNVSLSASGWVPAEAGDYLTMSWDREGAEIAADEVVQAVLTLDVSGSITGITDFSFDIVIEGTG